MTGLLITSFTTKSTNHTSPKPHSCSHTIRRDPIPAPNTSVDHPRPTTRERMLVAPKYHTTSRVLMSGTTLLKETGGVQGDEIGVGDGWGDQVMPTLRKRLEAESTILERRLSQRPPSRSGTPTNNTTEVDTDPKSNNGASSDLTSPMSNTSAPVSRIPLPSSSIPRSTHMPIPKTSLPTNPTSPSAPTTTTTTSTKFITPVSSPGGSGISPPRHHVQTFTSLRARVKSTPSALADANLGGDAGKSIPAMPVQTQVPMPVRVKRMSVEGERVVGGGGGSGSGLIQPGFAGGSVGGRGRGSGRGTGSGLSSDLRRKEDQADREVEMPGMTGLGVRSANTGKTSNSSPSTSQSSPPPSNTTSTSPTITHSPPPVSTTPLTPPGTRVGQSNIKTSANTSTSPTSSSRSAGMSRLPVPQARSPPRLNTSGHGTSTGISAASPTRSPSPSPGGSGSTSGGSSDHSHSRTPALLVPGPDARRPSGGSVPSSSGSTTSSRRYRSPSPTMDDLTRSESFPDGREPVSLLGVAGERDSFHSTMRMGMGMGGEGMFEMDGERLGVDRDGSDGGSVDLRGGGRLGDASDRDAGGDASSMVSDLKDEVPPFLMDNGELSDGHHKDVARVATIYRPAGGGGESAESSLGGGARNMIPYATGSSVGHITPSERDKERKVAEAMAIAAHGHDLGQDRKQTQDRAGMSSTMRRDQSGSTSSGYDNLRSRTGSLAHANSRGKGPRGDSGTPSKTVGSRMRLRNDALNQSTMPPRSNTVNEFGRFLQEGQTQQQGVPNSSSAFSLSSKARSGTQYYPPAAYAIPKVAKNNDIDVIPTVAKRLAMEDQRRQGKAPLHELMPAGEDDLITEWAADGTPLKRVRVVPRRVENVSSTGAGQASRDASFGVMPSEIDLSDDCYPPTAPGMFNYDHSKAYDPSKVRTGQQLDARLPAPIRTESTQSIHTFPIAPGQTSPSPFSNFGPPATPEREPTASLLGSPAWGSMARRGSETGSAVLRKTSLRFRSNSTSVNASQVSLRTPISQHRDAIKLDGIQAQLPDVQPWSTFPAPPESTPKTDSTRRAKASAQKQKVVKKGKGVDGESHGGGCKCIIM